jgi:CubicO group peptidase (beta-lactamase class C family)
VTAEAAALDQAMTRLLREFGACGGALAIAESAEPVLTRNYGWRNVDKRLPVEDTTRFRIASVSKTFTSAAILRLCGAGRLGLDDKAADRLPQFARELRRPAESRWREITIRQLLQHTAGWDSAKGFDPMFATTLIATETGDSTEPLPPAAVVRYMIERRRLDFAPGTRFAYSNFGYCVLGRVIEASTGASYADAVRRLVLEPLQLEKVRLGRTLPEWREETESNYYPKSPLAPSVFRSKPGFVPEPDGAFSIETMDAHGGWVATAAEVVGFARGLWEQGLLTPALLREITKPPNVQTSGDAPGHYGLGWLVKPSNGGSNCLHTGSLPGTSSAVFFTGGRWSWAALVNYGEGRDTLAHKLSETLEKAAEAAGIMQPK